MSPGPPRACRRGRCPPRPAVAPAPRSDTFGMSSRELLAAQLRLADLDLELLDVDRGEDCRPRIELLGHDDRILEVVAVPGHEGDEDVLAEGELAVRLSSRRRRPRPVAGLHLVAGVHQRLLVQAGPLVEADELASGWYYVIADDDWTSAIDVVGWCRPPCGRTTMPACWSWRNGDFSMPVATTGASVLTSGHGLALHVRAHERAVGVVVLEERDERRRDADELHRTDVDVVDVLISARRGSRRSCELSTCRCCRRRACRSRRFHESAGARTLSELLVRTQVADGLLVTLPLVTLR